MVTKSGIEKRLNELEDKMRPKKIETLADWVTWVAHGCREPRPLMDPGLEECLLRFAEAHKK